MGSGASAADVSESLAKRSAEELSAALKELPPGHLDKLRKAVKTDKVALDSVMPTGSQVGSVAVADGKVSIQIQGLAGSLHQLKAAPSTSVEEFRALVSKSLSIQNFELLVGSDQLRGGTLAEHGVTEGAQLTLVRLPMEDTLLMWNGCGEIAWKRTFPSTSPKVKQLVVGSYSAFMLLEDGTCWKVGPRSPDDESALDDPQELVGLRKSCSGPIRRLGIDYTTLVAIADEEVWLDDERCCGGAICAVLAPDSRDTIDDGEEELEGDDDENKEPDGNGDGNKNAQRVTHVRAERICGWDVQEVAGEQVWGLVRTGQGKVHMYASGSALSVPRDRDGCEGFEGLLEEQGGSFFVPVDCGGRGICRIAMRGCNDAAGLVLGDGCVAMFPCKGVEVRDGAFCVPVVQGLSGIVDITAAGDVALDKSGQLWHIYDQTRCAVVHGGRVEALRGSAAVVSAADGRVAAHSIGQRLTAPWANALNALGYAQSGRWYGMACLSGSPPEEGLECSIEQASRWSDGGANMLAYACKEYGKLLPEETCDIERIKLLLQADAQRAKARSLDGLLLLLTYAIRAVEGPDEWKQAVQLLLESSDAEEDLRRSVVADAVESGDADALEVLSTAGCPVTDDDRAKARAV